MSECETEGCSNERMRADVVMCPECWAAYQDYVRHAEDDERPQPELTLDDE